jgi:hypothetical protein
VQRSPHLQIPSAVINSVCEPSGSCSMKLLTDLTRSATPYPNYWGLIQCKKGYSTLSLVLEASAMKSEKPGGVWMGGVVSGL